jgi:predicted KAP-like P-loop ATPase
MKSILIFVLSVVILCGMQAPKKVESIEEKTLDSILLSMLRRYESGSGSGGSLSTPYPDSILVQVRVMADGDSVKRLLDKMGIKQFDKPFMLGRISCYVKPKHLRQLVNHPYIKDIQAFHFERRR